ncbi:MAG: tRNA-specific 2-thiouridylase MnmA [Chlamydiia bacterium]|nr:tRNA-specific 2-thiouridylase MnmA [Chlamydiia bacterium]
MKKKVAVALSGGVDSSLAAYLLIEAGYEVIGIYMKNWDDSEDLSGACPHVKDYQDVVSVCDHLNIPFYTFDFTKEYRDQVFNHFIVELKEGHTPNPDILCNREIKFKVLFDKAFSLGVDYLATGHYAQTQDGHLFRGKDQGKDQTYFLYALNQEVLKKVLFPIGPYEKSDVRQLAEEKGIKTHDKRDSTGICFIGKRNFKEFIKQYIPPEKGQFIDPEGNVLGENEGAYYYTIGQRRGMGIGGPGEAWYVVDKNIKAQTVTVAQGEAHPALFSNTLTANEASWIVSPPKNFPYACTAKIRYRQIDVPCIIEKIEKETLYVRFDEPQRAITPRQSIVFYQGEECLGGAMIINRGQSLFESSRVSINT